ncbi:putative polysaccharide biosynthesis protein [Lacticaseibacillus mingshuiensis]|uniref:putative polysaccharide biosynthesis protein n=1 Tax=Lacticaseibacillus mingshuiensis TaxID=2799574 RepID=UPI001943CA9A|nr:polysaccharide biosynthesis protein [Lacticaseibacillus mingshuiensis]
MDKQQAEPQQTSDHDKMLRGSAWMTAGSIFSRILGAIYVVPWRIWLGAAFLTANALFTKGYQIYSVFLLISTAGVPGAISKQVSHYNAMGEYRTGLRIFKYGAIAMTGMGVVSCALMWLLAPVLALHDPALTAVFRSLAWPLLLIPPLSIMRGFFQGYNEMAPSAISQFIEQLARVAYMLLMTFSIMRLGSGDYVAAVTQSTFAAFIGALFGLAILVIYFFGQRHKFTELIDNSVDSLNVPIKRILLDIVHQAIPFIIMDSAINIYYIIDQYTFNPMMMRFYQTTTHQLDEIYALFAGNANKLIMIIVSLAVAMAVTALPLLSAAKTRGEMKNVSDQITNILQLFFIVMIPAAMGMIAIAQPLYVVFYGYDSLGIKMLAIASVLAVLLGLFSILATILQGLFHNKLAILEMLIGMGVKLLTQMPFIYWFSVYGPTLASMAGMLVSCVLMLHSLRGRYHYRFHQTLRRTAGIFLFSAVMAVVVGLIVFGMSHLLNPASAVASMITILIALPVGVAIYGYAVLKTRLADLVIGERVGGLRRRLHIS